MKAIRRLVTTALATLAVIIGAIGVAPPAQADGNTGGETLYNQACANRTLDDCARTISLSVAFGKGVNCDLVGWTCNVIPYPDALEAQVILWSHLVANSPESALAVTGYAATVSAVQTLCDQDGSDSYINQKYYDLVLVRAQLLYGMAQKWASGEQPPPTTPVDPGTPSDPGTPPATPKDFSKSYAPSISGHAVVGQTLTAKVKTWKPSEAKGWQWQSNGVDIAGATSYKYKVTAAELGTAITVKLTGSKAGYNSVTKVSKPTKTVAPGKITRGKVKVKGSRHVGATLSAYTSKWTSGVTFACQWYKNKVLQVGATACKYVLGTGDYRARMSVAVSATKAGYYNAKAKVSSQTGKIAKGYLAKGTVTITGTPQVNETLTVNPGTWSPDGVTFKYQWYYGSRKISGATAASYTLTAKQLGKYVRVKVTGSLPFYNSAYKYSAWTAKVAPVPAPPVPPEPASGTP